MVNTKQKPDKPVIKKKEVKKELTPMQQIEVLLNKHAQEVNKSVSIELKKVTDHFSAEVNRLDNKTNTVAKVADRKDEKAVKSEKNPIDMINQISGTIEKIMNSPIVSKIVDTIKPAEPVVNSVEQDPEYISYMKERAKKFDDLLEGQLNQNYESLKIKNLQARKELDSDL